jgi:hypothetical protein
MYTFFLGGGEVGRTTYFMLKEVFLIQKRIAKKINEKNLWEFNVFKWVLIIRPALIPRLLN